VKLQSIQFGQMSGLLDNRGCIVGINLCSLIMNPKIVVINGKKSQREREGNSSKSTSPLPGCVHTSSWFTLY